MLFWLYHLEPENGRKAERSTAFTLVSQGRQAGIHSLDAVWGTANKTVGAISTLVG